MADTLLGPRFDEALAFACVLHRQQRRKGTEIPYASHLLAVASLALEHGASEDEAIAALLHDAAEDQGIEQLDAIRDRFGHAVAEIVAGCTDSKEDPKPPWRDRKLAYLDHLTKTTPSILLVTSADKLHNARCILLDYRELGEALWDRFSAGKDGVLWYYGELVSVLKKSKAPQKLVAEFERTVGEIERLADAA